MSELVPADERLWTRLEIQLPSKSGLYRIRNAKGKEATGHFVRPEEDEFGGGWGVHGWPGGDILEWAEMHS